MSLVKNIGIGKQVYTFQYDIDFKALQEDFLSVLPELKEKWTKKGLFPTQKEVDEFAAYHNEKMEIDGFALNYGYGGVNIELYIKQTPQSTIRTVTVAEIYKTQTQIHHQFYKYFKRIKDAGEYVYMNLNRYGQHQLRVR